MTAQIRDEELHRAVGRIEGTLIGMKEFEEQRHETLDRDIGHIKKEVGEVKQITGELKEWKIKAVATITGYVAAGLMFGQIAVAIGKEAFHYLTRSQ